MWYPGQAVSQETINLIVAALHNDEVKAEVAKQIRIQMDNERIKNFGNKNGQPQSYESLTSGNVNMQAKMAATGYDTYGRTIITGNANTTNNNTYKKMKNRIKYGKAPQNGYYNHGGMKIV